MRGKFLLDKELSLLRCQVHFCWSLHLCSGLFTVNAFHLHSPLSTVSEFHPLGMPFPILLFTESYSCLIIQLKSQLLQWTTALIPLLHEILKQDSQHAPKHVIIPGFILCWGYPVTRPHFPH